MHLYTCTVPSKMSLHSHQVSKALLEGLYDDQCILSRLRGCQNIMRTIWVNITDYWAYCETMIELPQNSSLPGEDHIFGDIDDDESYPSSAFLTQIPFTIIFPPPTDINSTST